MKSLTHLQAIRANLNQNTITEQQLIAAAAEIADQVFLDLETGIATKIEEVCLLHHGHPAITSAVIEAVLNNFAEK